MKGLILTYIVTVVGSIFAFRKPLIGLYVYVGFSVLRPQAIFGWAGDINKISLVVGVAMLIGWAFQGFGTWRFGRSRALVALFLFFVGWFALSGVAALDPSRSMASLLEFSKIILPVLVGLTLIKGEADWGPLLWTMVMCQGYVGFEMNWSYLHGYNRAVDGFAGMDNNCFAATLVCMLGPALALTLTTKKLWAKALAGAATLLILHSILLTFSRGGMVGLLAVGVVAFVMIPKRPLYMGVLILVAVLAVRLTGPELAARYSTTLASDENRDWSAQSRVDLWKDCILVIKQHPILGVGPANWRIIASTYGWSEGKSAHSVWMETAAETGVPGALALFLFFTSAALMVWKIARERLTPANRLEVALAAGVVLSLVGFIVAGQFVSIPGLEIPYYVTMLGMTMLKARNPTAELAKAPAVRPMSPMGPIVVRPNRVAVRR